MMIDRRPLTALKRLREGQSIQRKTLKLLWKKRIVSIGLTDKMMIADGARFRLCGDFQRAPAWWIRVAKMYITGCVYRQSIGRAIARLRSGKALTSKMTARLGPGWGALSNAVKDAGLSRVEAWSATLELKKTKARLGNS